MPSSFTVPIRKAPSLTGDIRIAQSAYTETITIASLARRATLPIRPRQNAPTSIAFASTSP